MLIFYADGSQDEYTKERNPELYDKDGRPSKEFLYETFNTDDLEALFFDDPSLYIDINGVYYSLILLDNNSTLNKLPVNEKVSDMAISIDLIDEHDTINGTALFVAVDELGKVSS